MPTTARDVIDDAFGTIGVLAAETALEPHEIQDGLRFLNDMLSSWQGSYVGLGAAPVASATDSLRIPRWAVQHAKFQLAQTLASPYQKPLSAVTVANIKLASNRFTRNITSNIKVDLPDTLPIGSGNQDSVDLIGKEFFGPADRRNF